MERPSRTRIPGGLLGMVALVVTIEAILAQQPLRYADTASLNWRLSADDIPRQAKTCEVACFGDSLMKIGVIPEVIRSGTGKRAYNFGMARAPAPATYFMLKRLLEAGGHPSALMVEFKPSILAGAPKLSLRHFQEILTLRESWDLARDGNSLKVLPQLLLGRYVPSVRYRLEIREAIVAALADKTSATADTNQVALRNWTVNQGAHLNPSRVLFSGEISEQIHSWLRSDDWKVHRINDHYIDRIFKLAESRSIPVYWVIPPLPPTMQERREHSGTDAAFLAFVRSMHARHPSVTVIDGRKAGYDTAVFADHTHLNGRGSASMSHELATILGHSEGRSNWVDLPRFRDWPLGYPSEDAEQSKVALEALTTRRK